MQIKRESPERTANMTVSATPGKSGRPPNTAYLALMKPDEDWREIEDSTERRKIQNRLAQRAYRRSLRNRNKELESLKKQLGTFQESQNQRASRSRSSSGSSKNTCPSPDRSPSPPQPVSEFSVQPGAQPQGSSMPSLSSEWPRDCGALNMAYGMQDFMYFDACPPTNDALGLSSAFDLGGFEGLKAAEYPAALPNSLGGAVRAPPTPVSHFLADGGHHRRASSSLSADPAAPWMASSNSDDADMLLQPSFTPPLSLGQGPITPPEPDYTTAALPFTSPDGLGLVYPHGSPPPPASTESPFGLPHTPSPAALDPALFDTHAHQQPTPPPPPSSAASLDPHASLVHLAVASGNVEMLRLVLGHTPVATAARALDADGCTPAQRAARAGRDDMLAVLGEVGAGGDGIAFSRRSMEPMC